ncbi:S24 family peptidase [Enterobacter sp. ECC-219]|uniref:HumD family translesion DNA polymerase n=1 Tax=Enterobacter sp. ECC-219 TaxID=3116480 RepID=UPI003754331A
MGFPGPAADYVEERMSLDKRLIAHPSSTYMIVAGTTYLHAGIMKGSMLIVDSSLTPKDGSLLVCAVDGEFRISRYRTHPHPYLENPENGRREPLPVKDEVSDTSRPVFGVITYIINDARSGEFDDCPVMEWGMDGA